MFVSLDPEEVPDQSTATVATAESNPLSTATRWMLFTSSVVFVSVTIGYVIGVLQENAAISNIFARIWYQSLAFFFITVFCTVIAEYFEQ